MAPRRKSETFCAIAARDWRWLLSTCRKPGRFERRPRRGRSRGNSEGERKTVTALFADIKGSTELMEDLDPEEARAIIDPALKLMIDAVQRYDGYVVQSTGDGIFALFGAPVAHEDHPQRALYAALRMQEELRTLLGEGVARGRNCRSKARVGREHRRSGGALDHDRRGTDRVHADRAYDESRLADAGRSRRPGRSRSARTTRKLVEGYFALKPLGPTRVKGVSEPVNVYEVTGLGPLRTRLQRSAGRGLTKFVGREREMEALEACRRAGQGPATGRSSRRWRRRAPASRGCTSSSRPRISPAGWCWRRFQSRTARRPPICRCSICCTAISKSRAKTIERTRREKVTGSVLALDRALEDTLPYLFSLLGIVEGEDPLAQMDGQLRKRRTLEAIKRILLRESLNQPLMVIFEDLHWIDEATQELLNLLADSIGTAKILLLVNYRPEYSHQWNSKTYYTQLRLDPLGTESAEEMLSALLGDGVEVAPLKRLIIEKTEGNPFFMEETVQVLLDEGALVRDGAAVKLTRPLDELKIPPTVQGILAARIDRLPAGCEGAAADAGRHRARISAVVDSRGGHRNRTTNSTVCSMTCNWASSSTSSRRWATPNTSSSTR